MALYLKQKVVAAMAGAGAADGYDIVMSGHSRFDSNARSCFFNILLSLNFTTTPVVLID